MTHNRLKEESQPAWEAAKTYFEMGFERSIKLVSQKLHKSYVIIGRWSRKHGWVDRARSWDTFQEDNQARIADQELHKFMAKRAGRIVKLLEMEHNFSERIEGKVKEMMECEVTRKTVKRNGKTVVTEPMKWDFGHILSGTKTASELRRLSLNMPTKIEKSEVSGPDGGAIQAEVTEIKLPPNGRDDVKVEKKVE